MSLENITFGIEIETCVPAGVGFQIGNYHQGALLSDSAAPRFEGTGWKAEADGSIHASLGYRACEFVSPILRGEAGVAHLIEFVAWLNRIGAKTNASCGVHIHIGVASLPFNGNFRGGEGCVSQAIFLNMLAREVSHFTCALYAQTGTRSREQGHYCQPLGTNYRAAVNLASRRKKLNQLPSNRYQILNVTPFTRTGTVEFRCFAGTLNIEKVLLHLWSVLALCHHAAQSKYLSSWAKDQPLNGEQSVRLLLAKIIEGSEPLPSLRAHQAAIKRMAIKMARKYDRPPTAMTDRYEEQRAAIIDRLTTAGRAAEIPAAFRYTPPTNP